MRYTILSARFANADHTAAVVMTEEAAAVLLGASEDADLWPAVLETEPRLVTSRPMPSRHRRCRPGRRGRVSPERGEVSAGNVSVCTNIEQIIPLYRETIMFCAGPDPKGPAGLPHPQAALPQRS